MSLNTDDIDSSVYQIPSDPNATFRVKNQKQNMGVCGKSDRDR